MMKNATKEKNKNFKMTDCMYRFKKRKGFSLMEVILAVVVVSIATVMGFQGYSKYVKSAKVVEAKAEAATLELAMNQYNSNNPTAQLSSIDISKLSAAGLLQKAPRFQNGDDKCTYAYEAYNNGTFTTTEKHVVLKACTFADSNKIITAEGVF